MRLPCPISPHCTLKHYRLSLCQVRQIDKDYAFFLYQLLLNKSRKLHKRFYILYLTRGQNKYKISTVSFYGGQIYATFQTCSFIIINLFTNTVHTFKPKNDAKKISVLRIRSNFYDIIVLEHIFIW